MKDQYCPKCGGEIMFIIEMSDYTLGNPSCENGLEHLTKEQAVEATRLANIEWAKRQKEFAEEWVRELKSAFGIE